MNKLFASVFCLLCIGSCSASVTLSDRHMSALRLNQEGEYAFKVGDYKGSLDLYANALRINQSIENIDGIAVNLINMAVVYRKLKDKDNSHACVDEILGIPRISISTETSPLSISVSIYDAKTPSRSQFSSLRLSEAAFLKAMLYSDDAEFDQSALWADKALSSCKDCSHEARIYNLKARIALLRGDARSALASGNKGLDLNRKYSKDPEEEANSLRIMADARMALNEIEGAKKLYEDALLIDKTLGLSKKIALDLMGIGNALMRQGNCPDALIYFSRALSVGEAMGDEEIIKNATSRIKECL